jgi:hypothetical protein
MSVSDPERTFIMRDQLAKFLWALFLACVAALSAAAFGVGVLTGMIDGPARGGDVIRLADRPVFFLFQAAFYLTISVWAGVAARSLFKQFKLGGAES